MPRAPAGRLWNPTNSTPRVPAETSRRRRPSTPPPPAVPLEHLELDLSLASDAVAAGDYPLLTLPEQRLSRHSASTRASLQIERGAGNEQRISLPRSIRHSYDEKRLSITPSPVEETTPGPAFPNLRENDPPPGLRDSDQQGTAAALGLVLEPAEGTTTTTATKRAPRLDKGKGKEIMPPPETDAAKEPRGFSQDLERGPDVLNPRHSTASRLSGIGSAISSSNSSIMGDADQQDTGEEWGPQHPCYPHLNPHVPIDSPEYASTRIIRVRRDWLVEGDLAPTFSNLYPEILDPAGLSEQEFRRIIEKLNSELVPAFNPYGLRNVLDGVLGLATGWLWDDMGLTSTKSRLRNLEKWIERWNAEKEKSSGADDGIVPPKIIPLRQTAYLTVSEAADMQ